MSACFMKQMKSTIVICWITNIMRLDFWPTLIRDLACEVSAIRFIDFHVFVRGAVFIVGGIIILR